MYIKTKIEIRNLGLFTVYMLMSSIRWNEILISEKDVVRLGMLLVVSFNLKIENNHKVEFWL
jgi:hypothetical protein